MPERLVRTNIRLAIAVAIVILGFAIAFIGSYVLSINAVQQSQNAWCTALEILTKHPPKAPENGHPAEVDNYNFYLSLKDIERRYNCH